ncbi:hypothetical protein [Bradyrhizobium sp. BRP22]|uniref:hypothetical protein n=1 Tax=Bradyrhizobium sp. BRP22 TaxID=2793821 RepID=UPI0031FC4152
MPTRRVITVERITGIPRHLIRPDIYPTSSPKPSRGVPEWRALLRQTSHRPSTSKKP